MTDKNLSSPSTSPLSPSADSSTTSQPPYPLGPPPVGFNPEFVPPPPLPNTKETFSSGLASAPAPSTEPSTTNPAYNPDYTPASPPPAYSATAPPLFPSDNSPSNNNNNADKYNFQGQPIKPYIPASLPAASFTEIPTPEQASSSRIAEIQPTGSSAAFDARFKANKEGTGVVKFLKSNKFFFILMGLALISAIYLLVKYNRK